MKSIKTRMKQWGKEEENTASRRERKTYLQWCWIHCMVSRRRKTKRARVQVNYNVYECEHSSSERITKINREIMNDGQHKWKDRLKKHTWTRAVYTPNTPIWPFFVLFCFPFRLESLGETNKNATSFVCKTLNRWRAIFDYERAKKN